jgi:hypothetical protein
MSSLVPPLGWKHPIKEAEQDSKPRIAASETGVIELICMAALIALKTAHDFQSHRARPLRCHDA